MRNATLTSLASVTTTRKACVKMCNLRGQKTDYYIRETDNLDFEIDQTIITQENYLKHITGIKVPQERPANCPPLEEWYPYCNSYYPYAEDVDPLERVNHILGSKPSSDSLTSLEAVTELEHDFKYSEKSAQLQYLESNPVSFILLGKPGIGEQELGKRLAEYWQCIYIEPGILIEQEILSSTRVGQCIEFNLRSGRSIGVDVILRLVEKRVSSESAKHRGYVICGLPVIPNDLYEEDPISSESAVFTVKEMFDEIIETTIEIGMPPSSRLEVTVSSKYTSEVGEPGEGDDEGNSIDKNAEAGEDGVNSVKEQSQEKSSPHIPLDLGRDYDVCQPPEIGTDFEHQLKFLFDLLQPPFLIIYIMCSTEDVINRRSNYRYDVYSDLSVDLLEDKYNKLFHDSFSRQSEGSENLLEEFYDAGLHYVDTSNLRDAVLLPSNFPAHVSTQLDNYRYTAINFIENRILLHDPQYFVKVDGRTSVQRMFHLVKAKLESLSLQKVILPKSLSGIEDGVDSGEGGVPSPRSKGVSSEDCYRTFRKRDTPSLSFQWNWSDWGKKCPVSMKNKGICRNGQPDYAVHFMNKIFFLADEEAFLQFYRNPRPFLLPPYPKPACKIFIFGPKCSGKTAVAECLAYLMNGTVLSIDTMMQDFLMQKEDEHKEHIRQAAYIEGIKLLNEIRKKEAEEQEKLRIEQIKEWAVAVRDAVHTLIKLLDEKEKEQTVTKFEISSFPLAMKKVDLAEIETETTIAIKKVKDELDTYTIPSSNDANALMNLLKDKKKFFSYLPEHLKKKVPPKPATVLDDFVIDFANKAVEHADLQHIDINNKNVVDMFINTIRNIEDAYVEQGNNRGGWIMDGMISDTSILNELYPDYIADEIIVLKDIDNFDFLTKRFTERGETTFTNYREFFMDLGIIDAAWRAPSKISTTYYERQLVHSVLSEILDDTLNASKITDNMPSRSQSYRAEVSKFYEGWSETKAYFEKLGFDTLELQITGKPLPELMRDCIRMIEDRYRVGAIPFTEEDRAEEVANFGVETVHEEVMEEGTITAGHPGEDLIQKNRRYGDTSHFCPVTFKDHWVLWKGKEDFAVKFQDRVYLLSCESDMNKFLLTPRAYLIDSSPRTIPPPRICVVGVRGSGKTSISQGLAHNFGLMYVSFLSVLKKAFDINTSQSIEDLRRDKLTNKDIFNYLNYNYSLNEEFYVNNMCSLWFTYPTNQIGFILDDFPKRPSDIEFMTRYKLIPDIVIHLGGDETKIKTRLVDTQRKNFEALMEIKRKELAERNEEKMAEWEEKRQKRYKELLEEKREIRYAEKKGEKAKLSTENDLTAISQVSFDSIAEQKDIDEITRMLDAELPEILPLLPGKFEGENFERLVTEDITIESGFLNDIQKACEVELIPFNKVEVAVEYPDLTLRRALFITDDIKHRTLSIFERCYDISMEIADRLLSCGYYFLGRFGKTCPVQYHKDKNPFKTFAIAQERYNVFPVIHRSYIYFIVGNSNVLEFKKDPLKYVDVDRVDLTLRPFKVSIIGPPKSGKTTLAKRIKNEYGMKVITRGQAARYVLSYIPFSSLSETIELILRTGMELPDDLVAKCVEAATMDAQAITQGIVFDGFPNSLGEVKYLSYLGLVPNLAIDLKASGDEIMECLSRDIGRRGFPLYSAKFVKHFYEEWIKTASGFREWFDREYQVTAEVAIETSNWSVWKQTRKLMEAVFFEIQHYYNHAGKDWPVRLANMQVTPLEFLERQSSFKHFCPCCIHFFDELNSSGEPPDRTGLVQWRYSYYWLCPKHMELFLKTPDSFLPPYNKNTLPLDLPVQETLRSIPDNVFEDGNCIVCYKNLRVVIKGSIDFPLRYRNKTYLFNSERCLKEFMKQPWKFPIEISFRPPGNYSSLAYKDLPVLGMLEQYVATPLIKALGFITRRRPVIPGLSITASAAVGVGLYLKVSNERMPPELRPVYIRADEVYRQRMEKLIKYLDRMKSVVNPYLYYEEPLPKYIILESAKSESTESVGTAISKLVDEVIDDVFNDA